MISIGHIDQLHADAQAVARLSDAPFENRAHVEALADVPDVFSSFELE